MASIFCPPNDAASQFKKDLQAKLDSTMYYLNKYDGVLGTPALDDLLNSLGAELAGLGTALLEAAAGDAAKLMSAILSVVAMALTAGESAQIAYFSLMCNAAKEEVMFRDYLYKKAIFYLTARRALYLKLKHGTSKRNIKKTIEAQKQVEIALKNFKAVEKSLDEFKKFNTALHKRGMSAVDEAIAILTDFKNSKYSGTRTKNNPYKPFASTQSVYDSLKTSVDALARNVALEALSKLIDLKNNIWYTYKILSCIVGDVSIFSSKIESSLKRFEKGSDLNAVGDTINSMSITGQPTTPSNSYKEAIAKTANESQDFDTLDSTQGLLKDIKNVLRARGLYLVDPSVSQYIGSLADFEVSMNNIRKLAKQLLAKYSGLVEKTSTINDEMLEAINTVDNGSSENASILLKNIKWAADLSLLKIDTFEGAGAVQEKISEQLQQIKNVSEWMYFYKHDKKEKIHVKGLKTALYSIGFYSAAWAKDDADPSLDPGSILSFIGTLIGAGFLSGKALDEAIIACNLGIAELNKCIGIDKELILQLSIVKLQDNPLFNFLSSLTNAPAPFNAVGSMLSSGNIAQFTSVLAAASTAVGTAKELAALLKGCPEAGDSSKADKDAETLGKRKK